MNKIILTLPPEAQRQADRDLASLTASERELAYKFMEIAGVSMNRKDPAPLYVTQAVNLRDPVIRQNLIDQLLAMN